MADRARPKSVVGQRRLMASMAQHWRESKLHVDANNHGPSMVIAVGACSQGQLWVFDNAGDVPMTILRTYPWESSYRGKIATEKFRASV